MSDDLIDRRTHHDFDRRAQPPEHDRRQPTDDKSLIALVQLVHDDVRNFSKELSDQKRDEALLLAEAVAALMIKSFPQGDADGHKKAHEEQMKAIEDRAKFWRSMLFEVTKYGLLGVVGWLALKLWVAFLAGPKT